MEYYNGASNQAVTNQAVTNQDAANNKVSGIFSLILFLFGSGLIVFVLYLTIYFIIFSIKNLNNKDENIKLFSQLYLLFISTNIISMIIVKIFKNYINIDLYNFIKKII